MGREVAEELEMRMRKAEREEESYTELLHSTETNMQVSDTILYGASVITFNMSVHDLDALEHPSGFTRNNQSITVIQILVLARVSMISSSCTH